jgi:hypothetical protein
MKNFLVLTIVFFLLTSCGDNPQNSNALLPDPIGSADEVLIVMDDHIFSKELTKGIKETIIEPYKILPQSQARFLISTVKYSKLNTLLKRFINPVFVLVKGQKSAQSNFVNQFLTEEDRTKVKANSSTILFKKNLWARNQNIMIIVVASEKEILPFLEENSMAFNKYFDESNLGFYKKVAYIDGVNKTLNNQFNKFHNLSFDVPIGYVIAKNEKNFVLLRKDEDKSTLFLMIDIYNYNAAIPINNLGIETFNTLGHHLDGDKEGSFVIADTTLGFDISKTSINNLTTFENAGLWVMENDFVGGGPFINQYVIDNKNNRVIYLAGMVYGPGEKNKKKYMRQFEAMFSTLTIH